ncbi:hypothetical protein ASPZODRAFT_1323343 [Penicilliopsis zonata CBS 506.65]|uniref:Uncharacterized protein n=1 Tax=Penicilliopsis zonata CBS 506.65 TaxID=1073090 RepID=A0A1L9SNP0_9EURO|nr:hypothetical protein ASPZODRAFT_1323343 [Penicilliopsis zonata CBS 506.65]OJJ48808.1 hypothetical protein ASPZODRAFT_1323343 [Penicilliopsis zonata CBS 506.65]
MVFFLPPPPPCGILTTFWFIRWRPCQVHFFYISGDDFLLAGLDRPAFDIWPMRLFRVSALVAGLYYYCLLLFCSSLLLFRSIGLNWQPILYIQSTTCTYYIKQAHVSSCVIVRIAC